MSYLDELNSMIDSVTASLDRERDVMAGVLKRAKAPGGSGAINPADARAFDAADQAATALDNRLAELKTQHGAASRAEPIELYANRHTGGKPTGGFSVVNEGGPYRSDGAHSYFRDMFHGRFRNDTAALDRLQRNNKHSAAYSNRAALNTTDGTGGDFVPPLYLINEFAAYARPGRPSADLCMRSPLPSGTDSINLPKIATGSAVAYQGTQNTLINETDLTTSTITSGVFTIAGGQTFSMQVFDQSPVSGQIDRVIFQDLSADLARFVNASAVLGGSGTGQPIGVLNLAGTNQLTWTTGSPTPGGFVSAVADAQLKVATLRYLPATAIVMHPRRWAWLISQVDTTGRPIVPPGVGTINQNSYGSQLDGNPAQGRVGTLLGLDVVVDATVPTNLGVGTNQDPVIVARWDDLYLWESELHADVYPQTFASTGSLYARVYEYISFQPGRYPASISVINGTGLVAPTFAA